MTICPATPEEFLDILRRRHAILLQARKSKKPGEFKNKNNRAGSTEFVDHQLVIGTLKKAFEWYTLLKDPFAKATYMMFIVSEVHPFLDGNGRVARVMMNAELNAAGETRILIPTIYRSNYLVALKALSQTGRPVALFRALDFVQLYAAKMDWSSYEKSRQLLEATHAFVDPQLAELEGIRLTLPGL